MMKDFSMVSFIVGIMTGALLSAAWFLGDDGGRGLSDSPPSLATTTVFSLRGSDAISVADQLPGESVNVGSVAIPPISIWVAVREMNGRDMGNVLGAVRIIGSHSSVGVPLLRPTESGRSYAIELYRDDNDGVFDPVINSVYIDFDTGMRVVTYFRTADK